MPLRGAGTDYSELERVAKVERIGSPACLADIEKHLAHRAVVAQRRMMTLSTTVSTRLMMMQLMIGK